MDQMTTLQINDITARQNRAFIVRVATGLREMAVRRAARRALLKLDDRMLKDIGLNRASVMSDLF
ncbi:MAG: DUF1127 domain-containing protein [Rhizobiales bacterium]|nr:DUF1127 domain-containing protein [Hyphomicrobiales bacterium]